MLNAAQRAALDPSCVQVIIGLEVHVQLKTDSKLFCGCSTRFGAEPNTQTCPICCGLPGALPVINEQAVWLAAKTGLALNCKIAPVTRWDRKNYFYPDLPKGYQISQLDFPICGPGALAIDDPQGAFESREIRIERAHLEEDAGKSVHEESRHGGVSRIDLNRAGTPLLEIVTLPDLRSPTEAKAFLSELKLILTYLEVSDCNMQEGSLRCDGNINLHIATASGAIATPIVEIKNMNSFRNAERSLAYEADRQWQAWRESGLTIDDAPKQTRGWNDATQSTTVQREKEAAADYRYFPDPDLRPYRLPEPQLNQLKSSLSRLPADVRTELQEEYGLNPYDTEVLVGQGLPVVEYFVAVARLCGQAKVASNWIGQEVLRHLNERQIGIDDYPISAEQLAVLLQQVVSGNLDQTRAKEVLDDMLAEGGSTEDSIRRLGIETVNANELDSLCRELIEEFDSIVIQIRDGNMKAVGALIGEARKRNANVNAGVVRQRLIELIADGG